MALVAGVVEVAAGRAEAGCSGCAGGPVKAGAMVGLGWLRRLLGSVGARRGVSGGGAGVVVDVELLARGAGAGAVLPCVDIDELYTACTHGGRHTGRAAC
jgi:hypothetical protein